MFGFKTGSVQVHLPGFGLSKYVRESGPDKCRQQDCLNPFCNWLKFMGVSWTKQAGLLKKFEFQINFIISGGPGLFKM